MLNEKQKAFCEHYASCMNATEAAKRAGYSQKTAYSHGQRLLKNAEIKKYIEELIREPKNRRIARINEVLEFLTKTMRNEEFAIKDRLKAAMALTDALEGFEDEEESVSGIDVEFEDASGEGGNENKD